MERMRRDATRRIEGFIMMDDQLNEKGVGDVVRRFRETLKKVGLGEQCQKFAQIPFENSPIPRLRQTTSWTKLRRS